MKTTLNEKEIESLVAKSITSHNIAKFIPIASVFRLTPEQIKKELLNCARTFITDAQQVTLDINYKNGEIGAFVWLPTDSSNVRDTSTMCDNSAIRRPIYRYSNELRDFMNRFSPDDSKRLFGEDDHMNLVGVPIRIDRMMSIIFDMNGNDFSKTYNTGKSRTRIDLRANFSRGEDNRTYGKLRYIEVTKRVDSDLYQREPRPKKSFKC